MPLIPFPNVPPLPGVPNLRRAAAGVLVRTGIAPAIMGLDRFGLLSRFLGPQWGVFSAGGAGAVLVPDTIASIEFKGDSDIANHPVEKGGFASYNKVAKPFEVSVVMTCSGGGQQSRSDFLSALKDMIGSQATKGMHVLARFAPQVETCGIWTDGNRLRAIEAYPSACKRSATMAELHQEFGIRRQADGGLPEGFQHGDQLDALTCALIGWLFHFQPSQLLQPPPDTPVKEGWIFAPADG